MESKIRGWFFVGLVLTVAAVLNLLVGTFGQSVHEFLDNEKNYLLVRIVIGAIGVLLVAAAVLLRIRFGRGTLYLVSDLFAVYSFVAAAAVIAVISVLLLVDRVCAFPNGFLMASFLFLLLCSVLVAIRAGKTEWIIPIMLAFLAVAMLTSALCPPL